MGNTPGERGQVKPTRNEKGRHWHTLTWGVLRVEVMSLGRFVVHLRPGRVKLGETQKNGGIWA